MTTQKKTTIGGQAIIEGLRNIPVGRISDSAIRHHGLRTFPSYPRHPLPRLYAAGPLKPV